jgi:antitoxin component of MazEF toxin-antitoxin module
VTLPKALASQYRIRPGDDILWVAAGDAIRVVPARANVRRDSVASRLELFDRATERHAARARKGARSATERGWKREDLYDRGRSR